MFSQLMIQLLFIFLPGIFAVILIKFAIATERELNINEWIAYSFVIGVLSYLPASIICQKFVMLDFLLNHQEIKIVNSEILIAIFFSLLYSVFVIFCINKEWYHWILRKLGLSTKFGKKYLIEGVISSSDPFYKNLLGKWVSIRYQEKELVFTGCIKSVNITENNYIELILAFVNAYYDNKNVSSYSLEAVYIHVKPEEILIEFMKDIEA